MLRPLNDLDRAVSANDGSDDLGDLRLFGRVLARDDRIVRDDAAAGRLVEKLVLQLSLAPIPAETPTPPVGRVEAFRRFVRLHRRQVRRHGSEDGDGVWGEPRPARQALTVRQGVRSLPLDQREALLLVTLSGFSHREAAEALDISLSQLIDRLDRARERLARAMGVFPEAEAAPSMAKAPYLRVIK